MVLRPLIAHTPTDQNDKTNAERNYAVDYYIRYGRGNEVKEWKGKRKKDQNELWQ